MKKYFLYLLTVLLMVSVSSPVMAHTVSTVNSNAAQTTKDVYNWLSHLPNRSIDRVLSGAFGGYSNVTFSMSEANNIKNATNVFPSIYACDYARGWDTATNITDLVDYSCNTDLKTYWNNGGIPQISLHLPSPVTANGGGLKTAITNSQYADIMNDSTAAGQRWNALLSKVADGLQDLEDSGVTVLFRPLHEMNGEWFWWGASSYNGNDTTRFTNYINLYRDMYNYFTNVRHLDNLIWVYSPDANRDYKTSYYPGDNYVDIVGLDAYVDDPNLISGYNEMLTLGKPFAFAEVGPQTTGGSFDYTNFINAIKSKYPKSIYFLAWNDAWSPLNNQGASNLYNDSWTLNRHEIWNGSVLSSIVEDTTTNLYDFETGTQGWTGTNVSGGPWSASDWSANGSKSLKADVLLANNNFYTLKNTAALNLSGKTSLKARVVHASWGNVGSGMTAKLYVKTGSTWAWYDGGSVGINSTTPTTLTLNLAGVPNLNDVKEVGIQFYTEQGSSSSAVFVDYITVN